MADYSIEDKLAGRDLHGLPCRVPQPTPEQERCSHTEFRTIDRGFRDWWTDEWVSREVVEEVCLMKDIPGTNNIRCTKCGYTRRY